MSSVVRKGKTSVGKKVNSDSLKKYLATSKKPNRIIGAIERHLLTRPLDTSRRQDVMHPSEILGDDWCHRAEYRKIIAALRGESPDPERPGLILQSIFDVGHAAHAKWQGYLSEMDALYGDWKCIPCGREWTLSRRSRCKKCGEVATYMEMKLFDNDLNIQGSTDGWVVLPDMEAVLEVKTIGSGTIRANDPALLYESESFEKAFSAIRAPFRPHRMQAQMYMHLMQLMHSAGIVKRTPPTEAILLYECKSNQQVKEFSIKYNPKIIEKVLEGAALVVEALKSGVEPECNVKDCKKCVEDTDE